MEVIPQSIPDILLIKPRVFNDDRGYFFESYNEQRFKKLTGINVNFVQDNESMSSKGALRGLHFQRPPFAQSKLVRVVKGEIIDVAVDIRKNSPTYGKHVAIKLSEKNKYQLFVPKGFAHGFLSLSTHTILSYKCDNFYSKNHEDALYFNDPEIGIQWNYPNEKLIISEKDKIASLFRDLEPMVLHN